MEIRDGKMHEFQFAMLAGAFFPLYRVCEFSYTLLYTKLNFLSTTTTTTNGWNYWQRKPQQIVHQHIEISQRQQRVNISNSSLTNKQTNKKRPHNILNEQKSIYGVVVLSTHTRVRLVIVQNSFVCLLDSVSDNNGKNKHTHNTM